MRINTRIIGLAALTLFNSSYAAVDADLRFIVKFKESANIASLQATFLKSLPVGAQHIAPMAGGAYTVTFKPADVKKAWGASQDPAHRLLVELQQEKSIQYAVIDRVGYFNPTPDYPISNETFRLSHDIQWDEFLAPAGIFLESKADARDGAWRLTRGHSVKPTVVAVLDTGVENHPALEHSLLKGPDGKTWGWNFSGHNQDVHDETGSYHGTHVAGTIAGYSDVMQGVGPELKILPIKIPGANSMFYESDVINGIYWAVGGHVPNVPDNPYPAKVLNMSFGIDERPGKEIDHCDEALQEALRFVRQQGAVVAAAAGNDNRWDHYNAPAACNFVMRIASTGMEGLRAYYSNYGSAIAFAAPGGDLRYGQVGGILSTVHPEGGYMGSGYQFYQGTSMASPHVAGVAGLLYAAREGDITPQEVEQTLYTTTHGFGPSTNPNNACVGEKPCGHGIVDAFQAVDAAMARYDAQFSAPSLKSVKTQCAASKAPKAITTANTTWLVPSSGCQALAALTVPTVMYQQGQIIADYGHLKLTLQQGAYTSCHVIGYDGVGCHA